jgi:hypothetical protein
VAGITVRDDTDKVLASVGDTLENNEANQTLNSTSPPTQPRGQHETHHFIWHTFKLFYHDGNHLEPVGKVTLYSTTELVFKELWLEYVLVIVSAILKTMLLWAFFLWFGYRRLRQPLYRLGATFCVELPLSYRSNPVAVTANRSDLASPCLSLIMEDNPVG